jgi:hypothetical protein
MTLASTIHAPNFIYRRIVEPLSEPEKTKISLAIIPAEADRIGVGDGRSQPPNGNKN